MRELALVVLVSLGAGCPKGVHFQDCDYDPVQAAEIVEAAVEEWSIQADVDLMDVQCVDGLTVRCADEDPRCVDGRMRAAGVTDNVADTSWERGRIRLDSGYDDGSVCRSALSHELHHVSLWPRDPCPSHAYECGWREGEVANVLIEAGCVE